MKKAFLKAISALTTVIVLSVNSISCFAYNFEDINYHWAKDEIESLVDAGIFSGVTQYRFEPNASVTRGMFAVVACRILNEDPGDRVAFFKDVDNNKYYGPYIAWAFEKQILTGYEDFTFRADAPVTRQEMFAIIARILKYQDNTLKVSEDYELTYNDKDQISDYAVEAIKLLSEKGYINGNEKNMINPNENATRAELCSILAKILGYKDITVPTTQATTETTTEATTEAKAKVTTEKASKTTTESTTKVTTEATTESTTKEVTETTTKATTTKVTTTKTTTTKAPTTTKATTETTTETTTNVATTKIAARSENSAKTILRNHKVVSISFVDKNGNDALKLNYFKRGSEYSCYAKLSDRSEIYIDEEAKMVHVNSSNSRLTTYLNINDSYDKLFGNVFTNDIDDISFVSQFTDVKGLEIADITYDDNKSFPSFATKLKSSNRSDIRNAIVYDVNGDKLGSFVVNRDVAINIIGGNFEIYMDKACENAYNYVDYIGGAGDLELYVKEK